MRIRLIRASMLAATAFVCCASAYANETTSYSYDALGRLVGVSSAGPINNGQSVTIAFDPAGNRSNVTVTGASSANLAIGGASVVEGGNLVFTVTRSGNTARTATVDYTTATGTATSGSDFSAKSGTLSFAANQATETVTVATIDDSLVESSETMTVTLSNASVGATITTATGTGTINDNDTPPANLAISNASATEGANMVFTVTRSGNTAIAASVNYATASGTATSGSDFTAVSGTLNFAANETSKTITVATTNDVTVESSETFTVKLTNASPNVTITTATGTGTINDNDVAPANLAISNASATEGANMVFTVTRSGNTAIAASVNYATASGTATSGSDFTAVSGTLNFAANETSKTITVATIDDVMVESSEAFTVKLTNPSSNVTITTATGTGTINDNDVAPANLAISNASATEGANMVFTVTRSGNTAIAASVNYATASGTATSGSDFTAVSGTLNFAANETSKTITVATIDDVMVESSEAFTVKLTNPSPNVTITTATGIGTINDNDVANQPPVANPDALTVKLCMSAPVNLTANDTDPEGDLPLTIIGLSAPASVSISITSASSVWFDSGPIGTHNITYTIKDSRGATSTGNLQVKVTSNPVPCD